MKDIQIPNGYFHLWKTYVEHQQLMELILQDVPDLVRQYEQILQQPIVLQSSYQCFMNLYERLRQLQPRVDLIYALAQYVKPEHFGVLGYVATRSNSVAESLSYIMRFSRLAVDGEEIVPMQMLQQDDQLILRWPYLSDDYILLNELTNAMMFRLARQIIGEQELPLTHVQFAHDAIMPLYEYQKFYRCKVEFKQPFYSFALDIRGLNLKLQQADPSLMQMLLQQAEEAIASKPRQPGADHQLHLIIAEYLRIHQQAPQIEDIATELHVSVRSLQRQLKQLGTSYKQILETERMQQCEKLLAQGMQIVEIASRLGYSDQSALARAFKAYFGETLLCRRRRLKALLEIR